MNRTKNKLTFFAVWIVLILCGLLMLFSAINGGGGTSTPTITLTRNVTQTSTFTSTATITPFPVLELSVESFTPTKHPTPIPTIKLHPTKTKKSSNNSQNYPVGVTAVCKDGTYSYSHSASGTCSHHGGVKKWINKP